MDDVRDLVRAYIERAWNRCEAEAIDELTAPGFQYHLAGQPGRDRAATKAFIAMTHRAFPDWRVEIADLIAEGDGVAVRWEGRVTHLGPFHGIPPTGRKIAVTGINLYRVRDGKIDGEWEQTDSLGMLQQLSVLPTA
jgi:steroid delta-isomerase-like uncharacterized protein